MNMTDKEVIEWIVSDPVLEFINISTPKAWQLSSPRRIAEWFDSEPFLDPNTGLTIGGTNRIRTRSFLALCIAHCTKYVQENNMSIDMGYLPYVTFRPFGNTVIDTIIHAISESTAQLGPTVPGGSVTGIPQIPFDSLPSQSDVAACSIISDLAQVQQLVDAQLLDIPSAPSQAGTIDFANSIEPQSDIEAPPKTQPLEPVLAPASAPMAGLIMAPNSEEEQASILISQKWPVTKPSSKRMSRPTPWTTPSNPDSMFKHPAINVDSLLAVEEPEVESESLHELVKSKGKGKAMKHKAREMPAFEPPAENDPIFGRINHNAGDHAP
ncbi:hypothetical protein FRC11_003616 [Ceratobasidium sp. 423]|nr:hypothetical protein FRC11_003616 [Ceratobasidium sp. 423]